MRRKFFDLKQAHNSPIAAEALERIGELYGIEKEIRGGSIEERRKVRQARSRPLLDSMREWLEASLAKLSKKSDTSAAIRYALGPSVITLKPAMCYHFKTGQRGRDRLIIYGRFWVIAEAWTMGRTPALLR